MTDLYCFNVTYKIAVKNPRATPPTISSLSTVAQIVDIVIARDISDAANKMTKYLKEQEGYVEHQISNIALAGQMKPVIM